MTYTNERVVARFEGGSVSIANRGEKKVVIVDESAMLDLLSAEDSAGMTPVSMYEFDSENDRRKFLLERYGINNEGRALNDYI